MRDYAGIYRPRRLSEVVGQIHIRRAISNLLRNFAATGEFPRLIVLAGPFGTGKTTLARILGSYLNCDKGPLQACLECANCKATLGGYNPDIWEVDAVSNSGVADMPQFTEWLNFTVRGRRKMLILDEAHQLSKKAWDSLLKLIEDGSQRATIVCCTTDVQKIPDTILSRGQQLKLLKLSHEDLISVAKRILTAEGIEVESEEVLSQLAKAAAGHARDVAKLIQTAQLYSDNPQRIELKAIDLMLGTFERQDALEFLQACLDKRRDQISDLIAKHFHNPDDFCNSVMQLLEHDLYLRSVMMKPNLQASDTDITGLLALFEDTVHHLKFNRTLAALRVGFERWLLPNGAVCMG